jgi:hypothetical protein
VLGAAPTRRLISLFSSVFRRVQHDARPLRQPLRGLAPRRQALKFAPLALRLVDRSSRLAHSLNPPLTLAENRTYVPIRTLALSWGRHSWP